MYQPRVKDLLYRVSAYRPAMKRDEHQRLREARERAGFTTPKAASEYFGWNENTYKSNENGARGISKKEAPKYAKAFHVSAGWILFEDKEGGPSLSEREHSVLTKFRMLVTEHQEAVHAMCDSLMATRPPNQPDIGLARRRRKA